VSEHEARFAVVYDDGANTYMLRGQAAQDLADGTALRRLREALAEVAPMSYIAITPTDDGWEVAIGSYVNRYEADDRDSVATAATIAEAADKCREALGE
jgi:hypothetical protein